jgi:hypothetical protein
MPKHVIISTINETINNTCSDAWRQFNNCSLEWSEPSTTIQDFWHNLTMGLPQVVIILLIIIFGIVIAFGFVRLFQLVGNNILKKMRLRENNKKKENELSLEDSSILEDKKETFIRK